MELFTFEHGNNRKEQAISSYKKVVFSVFVFLYGSDAAAYSSFCCIVLLLSAADWSFLRYSLSFFSNTFAFRFISKSKSNQSVGEEEKCETTADKFDQAEFTTEFSQITKHLSSLSEGLIPKVGPHS